MATIDVTVMGAGVFGLSVGYACARRGAVVRVIDPNGVAAGSSGGLIGALAPHVPENWNDKKAFQFESLMMAQEFWANVSSLAKADVGYIRSGRLQPLADARAVELAQARALSAQELWQGKAIWEVMPAGDATWMPPSPSGMVVHDTLSGLIHPRRATQALADAVVALGGEIVREGTSSGKVIEISAPPERFFRLIVPDPVRATVSLKVAVRSLEVRTSVASSAGSTEVSVGGPTVEVAAKVFAIMKSVKS